MSSRPDSTPSSLIAAVQPPHRFADVLDLSRDEMVRELPAMLSAYLGLPERSLTGS